MERHFAALKLIDSDSDCKLTRAASFSGLPSTRRICVEQSYQTEDSSGLVRQYSCEQILDKFSNTRQLKISEVVRSGNNEHKKVWKTSLADWQPLAKSITQAVRPAQIEYMEVDDTDSATHEVCPVYSVAKNTETLNKKMEVDYSEGDKKSGEIEESGSVIPTTDTEKSSYQDLKTKLRPLVPKESSVKKQRGICCYLFCVVPIALLAVAIFMVPHDIGDGVCGWQSNFSAANSELQEKIHGQSRAIHDLTYYLGEDKSYFKIFVLVGGTGVGKSYTAEILCKHFPFKDNIFIRMPVLKNTVKTHELSSQFPNLVIFENSDETNLPDIIQTVKTLQSAKNYCITIITIINMEHVSNDLTRTVDLAQNVKTVTTAFQKENIEAIVIPFQPLSEQALEMCIKDAARDNNLELTSVQVDRLKNSLLPSNTGCKKVYAKVQVMGRE